jgi:hypothetical protein
MGVNRDSNIESDASELEVLKTWHIENLLKFKTLFTPKIEQAPETLQSR